MKYDMAPSTKYKIPSKLEVAVTKYHPASSTKHEVSSLPKGHEEAPDLVRDCGEVLEAAAIGEGE